MSSVEPGAATAGDGWDETDLPVKPATDLFVTLGKAFRAYQLYDENNPVRKRFVEALGQAFTTVWSEAGSLTLGVEEDRITLAGQEVYRGETRADSLSFLFFKDGVREITFLPGIETDELERFLSVLQRARKLLPEGDDLITVLWEEDLQFFKFQYIDFLAEGVSLPEGGEGNSQADMQRVLEEEAEDDEAAEDDAAAESGEAAEPAPQTVSKDDFNPTLYALDPREMQVLAVELKKEFNRDLRGDVLLALFDRLEEKENRARQTEILGVMETLLPNFLSRGALQAATSVLQELGKLEAAGAFDGERLEQSKRLLDAASAPEAIGELIQALYDGSIRASPAQLAVFLKFLRGGALSPLLRASETVEHKELKAVLREAVQGIARSNKQAVVALLQEADPVVVRGAARMIGDLQITEAGSALAHSLAHAEASVRLAAIEAAVSLKASRAAAALEKTLDDPDRDVRIAAARALAELKYRPSAPRLAKILGSKDMRTADISEKVAFFEAYGVVAEDKGVELLDGLLNSKGFLGKREPSEIRAAAALALGQVPGPAARAALEKASKEDDAVVRSAVNRALRGEAS